MAALSPEGAGIDRVLCGPLRAGIADQLAALCEAVAGRADSQLVLRQLEQANLFIMPLDEKRRWYRYNHLFAERLPAGPKDDRDRRERRRHPSAANIQPSSEPLTDRELEVLRLVAIGQSNEAIATTLVIASEIVKKHLKNIYGKLEVYNRLEAVNRA